MAEGATGGAKAVGAAAGITAVTLNAHPVFLGIPSDVLLAAFAGAMFGLAYTRPEAWGTLLDIPAGSTAKRAGWLLLRTGGVAFTLSSIAIASAWAIAVAPHFPLLTWTGDVPPIPLAGLLAYGGQRLIPKALEAGGRWLDRRAEKP
jgi:hypothetical protein